jgi:predicted small secreted protein
MDLWRNVDARVLISVVMLSFNLAGCTNARMQGCKDARLD